MPKEGISLLPQEVKEQKAKEVRLARFRKVGFAFLSLSILAALGSFFYFRTLNSSLSQTNRDIEDLEQKIESLRSVEEVAYDVEQRSNALNAVFEDKVYFSYLLAALAEATTADIEILELTAPSATSANISGSARSYTSLAKFLLALKGDSTREPLFTRVELKEVSLDQQTGIARFNVNLGMAKGGLLERE